MTIASAELDVSNAVALAPFNHTTLLLTAQRRSTAAAAAQQPSAAGKSDHNAEEPKPAKRQRKTAKASGGGKAAGSGGTAAAAAAAAAAPAQDGGERAQQFFLMKSEPDVFSIDDLAARPNQTEPWDGAPGSCCLNWGNRDCSCGLQAALAVCTLHDEPPCAAILDVHCSACPTNPSHALTAGVRSHQAKKVLQSMRCGDQAFFYHSNAKPPGIVGIVEVRVGRARGG